MLLFVLEVVCDWVLTPWVSLHSYIAPRVVVFSLCCSFSACMVVLPVSPVSGVLCDAPSKGWEYSSQSLMCVRNIVWKRVEQKISSYKISLYITGLVFKF